MLDAVEDALDEVRWRKTDELNGNEQRLGLGKELGVFLSVRSG